MSNKLFQFDIGKWNVTLRENHCITHIMERIEYKFTHWIDIESNEISLSNNNFSKYSISSLPFLQLLHNFKNTSWHRYPLVSNGTNLPLFHFTYPVCNDTSGWSSSHNDKIILFFWKIGMKYNFSYKMWSICVINNIIEYIWLLKLLYKITHNIITYISLNVQSSRK